MDVHDTRIPDDRFERFLDEMPQVCVELVLETESGFLVGRRTTKPRVWFWPGSRLYKGERLTDAAHRVAAEELGIDVTLHERLGVHSHFWEPSQTAEGVSRHTVNVVYRASPRQDTDEIELDKQHSDYRFLTEAEPDLHEYVREYLTTYDLLADIA